MITWEYKIVRNMLANNLEDSLNILGRGGWEVVSLAGVDGAFTLTGNKLYAVLKRSISDTTSFEPDVEELAGAVSELANHAGIAARMEEFSKAPGAGTFRQLCQDADFYVRSLGDEGVLRAMPLAARSGLLRVGLDAGWIEQGVRTVIDGLVSGPSGYRPIDGLKIVIVAQSWRTEFGFLGDDYAHAVLDQAWAVARESLPKRATPALRELCKRINEGADPSLAWGRILITQTES